MAAKKPGKWSMTLENAEKFEAAMKTVPMKTMFNELATQALKDAKKIVMERPAPMGATPGTKGKSSSGNTPTPGRTFWKRGIGAFRVPGRQVDIQDMTWRAGLNATRPVFSKGSPVRSLKLQLNWRTRSERSGNDMSLFTEVAYAGRVHGGKDDKIKQTKVMDARGWLTVDEVAKKVEANAGKILRNTVAVFLKEWLERHGISTTAVP